MNKSIIGFFIAVSLLIGFYYLNQSLDPFNKDKAHLDKSETTLLASSEAFDSLDFNDDEVDDGNFETFLSNTQILETLIAQGKYCHFEIDQHAKTIDEMIRERAGSQAEYLKGKELFGIRVQEEYDRLMASNEKIDCGLTKEVLYPSVQPR